MKESRLSNARALADQGIPRNDRVFSILLCVYSSAVLIYFLLHQIQDSGFFTDAFGGFEKFLLYASSVFWIVSSGTEGVFGLRFISRMIDAFGGLVFVVVATLLLCIIFPFDFTFFADILPESLRFLLRWISDPVARGIMIAGIVLGLGASVYSPIAYGFVDWKWGRNRK